VRTAASDVLSNVLVKRGFTFVDSTIMYAFMQATGLIKTVTSVVSGPQGLAGLAPAD
jgi:DNA-3-methyladenine glycosylase I